jgi:hypothetical protein
MLMVNFNNLKVKLIKTNKSSSYFNSLIDDGYEYVYDVVGWNASFWEADKGYFGRSVKYQGEPDLKQKYKMLFINPETKDVKLITTFYESPFFNELLKKGYKYVNDVAGRNVSLHDKKS